MKIARPEKFETAPDAILFGFDNTLYAREPAHAAAWKAVGDKVRGAYSIPLAEFDRAAGEAGRAAAARDRLVQFHRAIEIMGLGSRISIALDLEQTYWRTFMAHAAPFDGVREFLDDVRLSNLPAALVADLAARIEFRKILYWELDGYFDCVVAGEETEFGKPDAAPFELALEKLQPAGGVVWTIGGDAERDIVGARNAIGAVTLQKLHRGAAPGRGAAAPDASFENWRDARKFLAALLADR